MGLWVPTNEVATYVGELVQHQLSVATCFWCKGYPDLDLTMKTALHAWYICDLICMNPT